MSTVIDSEYGSKEIKHYMPQSEQEEEETFTAQVAMLTTVINTIFICRYSIHFGVKQVVLYTVL